MIWLGWTSNCWASSASVFSPLTAARATFALKAGVWFRRGRLLIVSPTLVLVGRVRNWSLPTGRLPRSAYTGTDRALPDSGCLMGLVLSVAPCLGREPAFAGLDDPDHRVV